MRLIDADKLPIYNTIEGIEKSKKGTVAIISSWVSTISIEEAPTVEAIPIAWLEMFKQRYKIQGGDEYKLLHFMTTEWKRWEKENEAD